MSVLSRLVLLAYFVEVGLVLLVRWISGAPPRDAASESPKDILRRRYARGEIDQPTFERMMREVE